MHLVNTHMQYLNHIRTLFKIVPILLCIGQPISLLATEDSDTLVESSYDKEALKKATARARSEMDYFLQVLKNKDADSFSVKVAVKDNWLEEHFWLTKVTFRNGNFQGFINNHPTMVKNVEFGQMYKIRKHKILDWMFTRKTYIHGGYTLDPLLETLSKKEADSIRKRLVR